MGKFFKLLAIAVITISVFYLGYVTNLLNRIEMAKSFGYEKVSAEVLNDISQNQLNRYIETKQFIEIDGVFYARGN